MLFIQEAQNVTLLLFFVVADTSSRSWYPNSTQVKDQKYGIYITHCYMVRTLIHHKMFSLNMYTFVIAIYVYIYGMLSKHTQSAKKSW